jgi:uncharacterized repeat protein (TIGR03803 family)
MSRYLSVALISNATSSGRGSATADSAVVSRFRNGFKHAARGDAIAQNGNGGCGDNITKPIDVQPNNVSGFDPTAENFPFCDFAGDEQLDQFMATGSQPCATCAFPMLQILLRRIIVLAGLGTCLSAAIEADVPGIHIDVVHTFQANEGRPRAGLILAPDGKLYGTTDCKKDKISKKIVFGGIVYRINLSGKQLEPMHEFSLPDISGHNVDGACPVASLSIGTDGLLYGTTEFGGSVGAGVLFRFNPADPTTFTTLHNFATSVHQLDGANPLGAAVPDGHGNFYGATHSGVIYKWDGSSVTPVHVFAPLNPDRTNFGGSTPYGSPVFGADGKLYGTTIFGGANGRGTVYSLDPATADFQVIHDFEDYTFTGNGDNTPLQSLFLASDGVLYGANEFGGAGGNGLVWKVSGGIFKIVHEFSSYSSNPRFSNLDGGQPLSTLIEGADGMISGTTFYGGANGAGTIFRIVKDAEDGTGFESIYSFDPANDPSLGGYPYSGLTPMPDGSMIGTTFLPGAVYRLTMPPQVSIQPAPIIATRIGRGIVSSTANAVVLNGLAPFSYAWSVDVGAFTIHTPGAQTTAVSAALAACDFLEGTLSVTVTDAVGRTAIASTLITYSAKKPPGGRCD